MRCLKLLAVVLYVCACSNAPESAAAPRTPDKADRADEGDDEAIPSSDNTNTSFDTALSVDTRGRGVLQDLRSATQVDFFRFEARAGSFYELTTNRRPRFSPDNVLALYDSELQPVAENDDGARWPGDAIDARLVFRAAVSGTYYARVEDPYTPPQVFGNPSFPLLYYQFAVRELGTGTSGVTLEGRKAPTQVRFAHDDASGYEYTTLVGELSSERDAVFLLDGLAEHALIAEVLASGPHGNGSSALGGEVRVQDTAHHALAQIDRSLGQRSIHPPVDAESYEVVVGAAADGGDNAFYAIDLVLLPDNPRELDDSANGALAGAETIDMQGATQRRGLLLTTLPANDIDYFAIDAHAGDQVVVACEGQSGGSGVHGLRAELRDAEDHSLASAVEALAKNLQLDAFDVEREGRLWIRLSNELDAATDVLPWTRCVVLAGP